MRPTKVRSRGESGLGNRKENKSKEQIYSKGNLLLVKAYRSDCPKELQSVSQNPFRESLKYAGLSDFTMSFVCIGTYHLLILDIMFTQAVVDEAPKKWPRCTHTKKEARVLPS